MPYVRARNSSTAATICAFSSESNAVSPPMYPRSIRPTPPGVIGTADSNRENANTAKASADDTSCSETPM